MKDHGIPNTRPIMTPTAQMMGKKLWSNDKPKKTGQKSAMKVESGKILSQDEMYEINLKFGEKIEKIKYKKNDDLAKITKELAQKNSIFYR